jgi:anti-sigma B factor antagonist
MGGTMPPRAASPLARNPFIWFNGGVVSSISSERVAMEASFELIENAPYCCPACGSEITIQPSTMSEESPCPHCGQVLWFLRQSIESITVLTFLPGQTSEWESVDRVDEVVAAIGSSLRIVVNLSRLRSVSAAVLGMLVRLHRRMTSVQAAVKICGLRRESLEVFKMTKLDKVLSIHYNEQNALNSF